MSDSNEGKPNTILVLDPVQLHRTAHNWMKCSAEPDCLCRCETCLVYCCPNAPPREEETNP